MPTLNLQPKATTASILATPDDGPTLIVNGDPAFTLWIGYDNVVLPNEARAFPLSPQASFANDGKRTVYGQADPSATNDIPVYLIPGGMSFFRPASLSGLGGAKVFVQATTPTGTIPLNSVWFDTANRSLQTWNGAAWVTEAFNATQLIQVATITATQVANATLTTAQLAAAAGILGSQIAAATITSGNIAANTIIAANIAANTITAAQLAAGIIYAGIVDGTTIQGAVFRAKNSFGATILTVNKSSGTWLLYADTGSATQGALIASAAQTTGADEFGNGFKAPGITAYGTNGTAVQIQPSTAATARFYSGDSAESNPGFVGAQVVGSGATRRLETLLQSPTVTGDNVNAGAFFHITSTSADLVTQKAGISEVANDGTNSSSITVQPKIINVFTPSLQVSNIDGAGYNVDQSIASLAQLVKTNPTSPVDITVAFNIGANTAGAGAIYCIEVPFTGVWEASGALNFHFDLNGTFTNLTPIAPGLATAGHNYGGVFRLYLKVLTAGAGGTCNIWSEGGATDTSVNRTGATSAELFGINLGFAFNTTINNTLAVAADFSVSNASQTIVGQTSTFTKRCV